VRRDGLFCPRSSRPMYVRWYPLANPSSSWENSRSRRSRWITWPNDLVISLSFEPFEAFFFIEHHLCSKADYKSTDYSMKSQFKYILIIVNLLQNSLVRRACESFWLSPTLWSGTALPGISSFPDRLDIQHSCCPLFLFANWDRPSTGHITSPIAKSPSRRYRQKST
jgi:hypothetical protein